MKLSSKQRGTVRHKKVNQKTKSRSKLERLERLYRESVRAHPDVAAIEGIEDRDGRTVSEILFDCLVTAERTDIDRGFLNHASRHFYLSDVLVGRGSARADVISTLAAHIPRIIFPDGTPIPSGQSPANQRQSPTSPPI